MIWPKRKGMRRELRHAWKFALKALSTLSSACEEDWKDSSTFKFFTLEITDREACLQYLTRLKIRYIEHSRIFFKKSLASENLFWLVKSNLSLATWLLSWNVSLEPCEPLFKVLLAVGSGGGGGWGWGETDFKLPFFHSHLFQFSLLTAGSYCFALFWLENIVQCCVIFPHFLLPWESHFPHSRFPPPMHCPTPFLLGSHPCSSTATALMEIPDLREQEIELTG